LEKWLSFQENEYRQKSRELWLQVGNGKSKFFYSAIKHEQARDCIKHIVNEDGKAVTQADLKQHLLNISKGYSIKTHIGLPSQD